MTRSSSSLWAAFASLIASCSAFVSSAAAWGVTFAIDPTLSSRVISPWIYGLNGPIGTLNLTYKRAIVGPRTVTYYEEVRESIAYAGLFS